MPNWRKVITSGSDASLSSLYVNNVTSSVVSASQFTGSLFGTASWAINALTASYAKNIEISGSINNLDWIDFQTGSDQPTAIGRLGWNDSDGTLSLGLKGGNIDLLVGETEVAYVYNDEATTLNKGEVVYLSGAQGNRVAVKRASAVGDPSSAGTLGFVAETITSGGTGFVITRGVLRKVNTFGLPAGALLYLSSSAGQYTTVKPQAPIHEVRLGYVERVDNTQGSIYVKVDNGYEIDELHDVKIVGASNGDLLVQSASLWINSKQLTGSYGLTGSLQATSFTGSLQGTASWATNAQTSSTADSFTVRGNLIVSGNTTIGDATTDSITMNAATMSLGSGTGILNIDSNTFVVDGNNNRVGIGTSSPQNTLDVIRGTAGAMGRSTYEVAAFSFNGDTKIGFYNAQNSFGIGGTSLLLGMSNVVTSNDSTYPGFEFQMSSDSVEKDNFVRYNFVGRNLNGSVVNYSANILNIYADGRITMTPTVNAATITAAPKLGIGTSSPLTNLHIEKDNNDYSTIDGSTSHIVLTNPDDSSGEIQISSIFNGVLAAKWRTNFAGNSNYITTIGDHSFYTGGDLGVGSTKMVVFNNGNVKIQDPGVGNASIDNGYKLDVRGITLIQSSSHQYPLKVSSSAAYELNIGGGVFSSDDVGIYGPNDEGIAAYDIFTGVFLYSNGTYSFNTSGEHTFLNDVKLTDNLIVSGNVTLGNASTDNITMNAATMSLGSGTGILNIDSNTLFVDGNNNRVGIGTSTPSSRLDVSGSVVVSGSLVFNPGASPSFNGEIVRFGSGTLTRGQLYFLSSSGTWSLANANASGSSTGMLGLAVGSSPTIDGLLIRGFAVSSSYTYGTGSVVYAATSSGLMTATSPSSSNHVVRVLGYQTTISNTIYFDPDKTWVTLA